MLGLKKGTVQLCDHSEEWELIAAQSVDFLKDIFGDTALDIQHTGSTAIKSIMAKPIIDIVVGVRDFDGVRSRLPALAEAGVVHRPSNDEYDYMMFVIGDMENEIRTHHIHVVPHEGEEWTNQMNFRDYLNARADVSKKYEALKLHLMELNKNDRDSYTQGKQDFFLRTFKDAEKWREGLFAD